MLNNFIKFQIILSVNLSGAVIIWCAAAHLSKKKNLFRKENAINDF